MTRVYKDYEVKIKMVQEQRLQLKMNFLMGYNMLFSERGIDLWWVGNKNLVRVHCGRYFQVRGNEQIFI